MNHLAHLYLSQSNVDLLIGNFIADQVKGKAIYTFSEGIQKGIHMHRDIDSFTDNHQLVLQGKSRLYEKYHKYSAVIIDMLYDHILAVNWTNYSPISLPLFAKNCYLFLEAQQAQFPNQSQRILHYMKKGDWLSSYAEKEGIQKALSGLDYRAKFDSNMKESVNDLYEDWEQFESEFTAFFKELVEHCQRNYL